MTTSSGDTVLDRVLRILSAFDARRRQLSVADLAHVTDIPLATAYRLV
ncbi:MAG: helix-turn-helix domain-containing protein, partial [Yaniella sp.]